MHGGKLRLKHSCIADLTYLSMATHKQRKYLYCVKRNLGTPVGTEGLTVVLEEWDYGGLPYNWLLLGETCLDGGGRNLKRVLYCQAIEWLIEGIFHAWMESRSRSFFRRAMISLRKWRATDQRTALQRVSVRFGTKQQTATVHWKRISVDYTRFK
jgi:hypothetical protein